MKGPKDTDNWARHYDMLLWTVTTIIAGAIGGLLVYTTRNFDIWLARAGFILIIIAVYFAANFRELRLNIEKGYGKEIGKPEANRKLIQWPIYVLMFAIIGALWLKLLIENRPDLWGLWMVLDVIGKGLMAYFGIWIEE